MDHSQESTLGSPCQSYGFAREYTTKPEAIEYGFYTTKGQRKTNEDTLTSVTINLDSHQVAPTPSRTNCEHNQDVRIFGIFDGHGGPHISSYVKEEFAQTFVNSYESVKDSQGSQGSQTSSSSKKLDPEQDLLIESLEKTIAKFDHTVSSVQAPLLQQAWHDRSFGGMETGGTTAVVMAIHQEKIVSASVGDSEIILCDNHDQLHVLFTPQTVNSKTELERIQKLNFPNGHEKMPCGTVKIVSPYLVISEQGKHPQSLGVTRAIGDESFKKFGVIPNPTIRSKMHVKDFKFAIIASDGLTAGIGRKQIVQDVLEYLSRTPAMTPSQICEKLASKATLKSTDNVTVILVIFHHHKKFPPHETKQTPKALAEMTPALFDPKEKLHLPLKQDSNHLPKPTITEFDWANFSTSESMSEGEREIFYQGLKKWEDSKLHEIPKALVAKLADLADLGCESLPAPESLAARVVLSELLERMFKPQSLETLRFGKLQDFFKCISDKEGGETFFRTKVEKIDLQNLPRDRVGEWERFFSRFATFHHLLTKLDRPVEKSQ